MGERGDVRGGHGMWGGGEEEEELLCEGQQRGRKRQQSSADGRERAREWQWAVEQGTEGLGEQSWEGEQKIAKGHSGTDSSGREVRLIALCCSALLEQIIPRGKNRKGAVARLLPSPGCPCLLLGTAEQ